MTRTEYVNLLAWLSNAEWTFRVRLELAMRGTLRATDCIKCAQSRITAQAREVRSVRSQLSAWFHGSRVGIHPWVTNDVHNAVVDEDYYYRCIADEVIPKLLMEDPVKLSGMCFVGRTPPVSLNQTQ